MSDYGKPNLFAPDDDSLLVPTALNQFVRKLPDGTYEVTEHGKVTAHPDREDEENGLTPVVSVETEITAAVGQNSDTYTMNLGISWGNGEMSSTTPLYDAIVEYRDNAGILSKKTNIATGKQGALFKTYAVIGISLARFEWYQTKLKEIGINLVRNPKDVLVEAEGSNPAYIFLTASMAEKTRVLVYDNADGPGTPILDYMLLVGGSFYAVVLVDMHLKRERDGSNGLTGRHFMSMTLRTVYPLRETTIRTPPLNKGSSTFQLGSIKTSNALASKVAAARAAKASSGNSIIKKNPAANLGGGGSSYAPPRSSPSKSTVDGSETTASSSSSSSSTS
jgi:hypothetical protein